MIVKEIEKLNKITAQANNDDIANVVLELEQTLDKMNKMGVPGIGLASNQIGTDKHIAIVRINEEMSVNLVNAEIVKQYDPLIFENEGCLSFPDKLINTNRYNEIQVKNDVEPFSFIATGLFAIAIQHEIDHLNGIIFMEREVKKVPEKQRNKQRPNDPCKCGSNRKYKKCCGKEE